MQGIRMPGVNLAKSPAQSTFLFCRQRTAAMGTARARRVSCKHISREDTQELEQQQLLPATKAAATAAQSSTSPSGLPLSAAGVEHVVLFKVKEDPATEAVFEEIRALKSLDVVSELSFSKVLKILGGDYTHVLHSRHPSRAALDVYAVHPSHLAVVQNISPFVEDRLAVDWEAQQVGLHITGGNGAARFGIVKLVDDIPQEVTATIFDRLIGLRENLPSMKQISVGLNFTPERAKGFNLGFLAIFDTVEELRQLNDTKAGLQEELRVSKVDGYVEGVVIVDVAKHP